MIHLTKLLLESLVVQSTYGVGPVLRPRLVVEIGDVRRFYSEKALGTFAGSDAPPNGSGQITGNHKAMSKIGYSSLRRIRFLFMDVYLQKTPVTEPVYRFME